MKGLRAWLVIGATGIVTASCSGSGGGNGLDTSPATLINKCDQICNNVVASCTSIGSAAYDTCLSACGDLSIVPSSCLDPFAAYLICLAGATSVSVACGPNGDDVNITAPNCEEDRQATLTCNASPGLVQACISWPQSSSCGVLPSGASSDTVFCVGAPTGCTSPSPNPLGIGLYCCP